MCSVQTVTLMVPWVWPNKELLQWTSSETLTELEKVWLKHLSKWEVWAVKKGKISDLTNPVISGVFRISWVSIRLERVTVRDRDLLPSVLSPGLEVNWATSTILTANCCPVSLLMHLLTTLKGPLNNTDKKTKTFSTLITLLNCGIKI